MIYNVTYGNLSQIHVLDTGQKCDFHYIYIDSCIGYAMYITNTVIFRRFMYWIICIGYQLKIIYHISLLIMIYFIYTYVKNVRYNKIRFKSSIYSNMLQELLTFFQGYDQTHEVHHRALSLREFSILDHMLRANTSMIFLLCSRCNVM